MPRWQSLFILTIPILALALLHTQTTAQLTPPDGPTYAQQLVEVVNQTRWQNGRLPPFKSNPLLEMAAQLHSSRMAAHNFIDHCDFETGSTFWKRIEQAGFADWAITGENIAAGYTSPEDVVAGWMQSQNHRQNILSTDFWEVGSGYIYQAADENDVRQSTNQNCRADSFANGPYYHYWTQDYGRRHDVIPLIINREAYQTGRRVVDLYMYGEGWAQSFRLRNENGVWSAWLPFASDQNWELSSGDGLKTVYAEISNGLNGTGAIRRASDSIWLDTAATSPASHRQYLPLILR